MSGLARLYEQFKDSTNLKTLLTTFLNRWDTPVTGLDAVLTDLDEDRRLDTAQGVQAEANGRIVGMNLTGLPDAVTRELTTISIFANRASGEPDTMMKIASDLGEHTNEESFAAPIPVDLKEVYPAAVILRLGKRIYQKYIPIFFNTVKRAKPAGVRMDIVQGNPAIPFGFSSDSGAFGFTSIAVPSSGGNYVGLLGTA